MDRSDEIELVPFVEDEVMSGLERKLAGLEVLKRQRQFDELLLGAETLLTDRNEPILDPSLRMRCLGLKAEALVGQGCYAAAERVVGVCHDLLALHPLSESVRAAFAENLLNLSLQYSVGGHTAATLFCLGRIVERFGGDIGELMRPLVSRALEGRLELRLLEPGVDALTQDLNEFILYCRRAFPHPNAAAESSLFNLYRELCLRGREAQASSLLGNALSALPLTSSDDDIGARLRLALLYISFQADHFQWEAVATAAQLLSLLEDPPGDEALRDAYAELLYQYCMALRHLQQHDQVRREALKLESLLPQLGDDARERLAPRVTVLQLLSQMAVLQTRLDRDFPPEPRPLGTLEQQEQSLQLLARISRALEAGDYLLAFEDATRCLAELGGAETSSLLPLACFANAAASACLIGMERFDEFSGQLSQALLLYPQIEHSEFLEVCTDMLVGVAGQLIQRMPEWSAAQSLERREALAILQAIHRRADEAYAVESEALQQVIQGELLEEQPEADDNTPATSRVISRHIKALNVRFLLGDALAALGRKEEATGLLDAVIEAASAVNTPESLNVLLLALESRVMLEFYHPSRSLVAGELRITQLVERFEWTADGRFRNVIELVRAIQVMLRVREATLLRPEDPGRARQMLSAARDMLEPLLQTERPSALALASEALLCLTTGRRARALELILRAREYDDFERVYRIYHLPEFMPPPNPMLELLLLGAD